MKTDEKLWEICMKIYREAYRKAEPKADFDGLIKSGEAKKPDFFMKYYLPEKEFAERVQRHTRGLGEMDRHKVSQEVYLGSGPTSVKRVGK